MKRMLILTFLLALALAAPAFAQEATPESTIVVIVPPLSAADDAPGVVGVQAAFEALLTLATNVTFIPFAAAFVVAATSLLKRVLPGVHSGTLAFTIQVATWIVITLALYFGVEQARIESVVELLTTALGAAAGLVGSSWASAKIYNAAKANDVPIIGAAK